MGAGPDGVFFFFFFCSISLQVFQKAAKLIGDQIRSKPGFIELRKIEAAREIAQTIAKSQNKVYLNAETLLLNLGKGKKSDD